MKRVAAAILVGLLVGAVSIPLTALPNAFNSIGWPTFNRNLRLTWFLGCALQGLLAAGLLAAAWQKARPSPSVGRVLQAWGLTALLGVFIPAPGILDGAYADGLTGWYAVLAGVAGAIFVWVQWPGVRSAPATGPPTNERLA